ncbi:MAG: hypothetical protein ACREN5_12860 [Gemmatimonadales bacterium]
MAALLVGMSVMAVMLSAAMPVWQTAARREREAELIFRGEQYAQAIALFQRRYPGTFPPSIDVLVQQKFLRRRYLDPITGGDFQVVYVGANLPAAAPQGGLAQAGMGQTPTPVGGRATTTAGPFGRAGVMGVVSTSTAESLRLYNGRGRYNEWAFVATQATTQAGAPAGAAGPQVPGRGGRRGAGAPPTTAPVSPGRVGQPAPPPSLRGRGIPQ